MEFLIMVDIFQYFSLNWKFTVKTDPYILGTNFQIRSKTTIVEKILRSNWLILEKNGKNLRGYFWEVLGELINRI